MLKSNDSVKEENRCGSCDYFVKAAADTLNWCRHEKIDNHVGDDEVCEYWQPRSEQVDKPAEDVDKEIEYYIGNWLVSFYNVSHIKGYAIFKQKLDALYKIKFGKGGA